MGTTKAITAHSGQRGREIKREAKGEKNKRRTTDNGVRVVLDIVAGNGYKRHPKTVGRKIWKKKIRGKSESFRPFRGFCGLFGVISTRIVNEVQGINRICYDITSKPPATIEWE